MEIKNLISNAIKFTDKGGITVSIRRPASGECKLPREHSIAISVIDTGIGIPEDKITAIFEAFQQADGTTSRKYGGTGLGLSISRELAKLLGGEIGLISEEAKGSRFTLYLPEEAPAVELSEDQDADTVEVPREIEQAAARGFESCSLGPRILKAETAAVAAGALMQYLFGDLGLKRS